MSGRAATVNVIPGNYALSVGCSEMSAPPGWQWSSLGEVARLESGHTPSREHPEYWDGGIPWIGIKDARTHHGGVISDTFQTVTQAGIDNSAARVLPAGTVCLSRTASVGYVVVMGREMSTSQDFVNWVCGPNIEPRFLQQLFIAENESLFRFGKGSTHTTIYFPEVKAFHVCLPPVNEQRRIVTKLEVLQARSRRAREALDAVPPLLEKLRQSILAAAFRGDLTKDWRTKHKNVAPASGLLKRIRVERKKKWEDAELAKIKAKGKLPTDDNWKAKYKEPAPVDTSELPELPEGWCWAGLSEIASLQLGQRRAPEYEHETQYPYLRAANITWRGLDLSDVKTMGVAAPESVSLEPGDVVLSEASGSPTEVGKPALWNGEIPGCCFQATVLRVRSLTASVLGRWLYLAFLRNASLGDFAAMAPGIGILHLTAERMRAWPVPLAPLDEQSVVADRVELALRRAYATEDLMSSLAKAHVAVDQSVLAKAFRGELIPQDPGDEPAETMLAQAEGANGAATSGNGATAAKRGRRRGPRTEEVT